MIRTVFFVVLIGVAVLNSFCSGSTDEEYVPVAAPKPKPEPEADPSMGFNTDHNAKLVVLEVEEFSGIDLSWLPDVFLGKINSEEGYDGDYSSDTSWIYLSPDSNVVYYSFWEYEIYGILGNPRVTWNLTIDRDDDKVLLKGRSEGIYSSCSETTGLQESNYCTFEFSGVYDPSIKGYSGRFTWQQFSIHNDCEASCEGTMALILE